MISSCLKIKENSGREAVIYRDGPVIFHCPESYITCQKKQTRSAMQSSGPKAQVHIQPIILRIIPTRPTTTTISKP
jgi:hypothetical protein